MAGKKIIGNVFGVGEWEWMWRKDRLKVFKLEADLWETKESLWKATDELWKARGAQGELKMTQGALVRREKVLVSAEDRASRLGRSLEDVESVLRLTRQTLNRREGHLDEALKVADELRQDIVHLHKVLADTQDHLKTRPSSCAGHPTAEALDASDRWGQELKRQLAQAHTSHRALADQLARFQTIAANRLTKGDKDRKTIEVLEKKLESAMKTTSFQQATVNAKPRSPDLPTMIDDGGLVAGHGGFNFVSCIPFPLRPSRTTSVSSENERLKYELDAITRNRDAAVELAQGWRAKLKKWKRQAERERKRFNALRTKHNDLVDQMKTAKSLALADGGVLKDSQVKLAEAKSQVRFLQHKTQNSRVLDRVRATAVKQTNQWWASQLKKQGIDNAWGMYEGEGS